MAEEITWTDNIEAEMRRVFTFVVTQTGEIVSERVLAGLSQYLPPTPSDDESEIASKALAESIAHTLVDPGSPLMHAISASVATALAMANRNTVTPAETLGLDPSAVQEMIRVTVRQELASLMESFAQHSAPTASIDVDVVVEKLQRALEAPRAMPSYLEDEFADKDMDYMGRQDDAEVSNTILHVAGQVDHIVQEVADIKTDLSVIQSTPSGHDSTFVDMMSTTNKRVDDLYNYLQRQLSNLTKDIRQLDATAVALRSLVDNQIAETQAATKSQVATFSTILNDFQQQVATDNTAMKEQFDSWTQRLERLFTRVAKAKEEEVRVLGNRIEDAAIRKTFEAKSPFSKKKP